MRFRLGLVVAALSLVSAGVAGAALPPGGTFTDDDGSVHEPAIEAIAAEGITRGCGDGLFCPNDGVTRGQMAAFLVRALDLTEQLDDPFVDDNGLIFESDIERLAAAGITKGCNPPDNDRFCPHQVVTRGEMAAFLVRALGYANGAGSDRFVDDDGSVFELAIDRLAAAGVTKGCNPPTNNRYCPGKGVTRAEMATFLTRALGLTPITPPDAWILTEDQLGPVQIGSDGAVATATINAAYGHSPSVSAMYGCSGYYIGQELRWNGLTFWIDQFTDVVGYMYWGGIAARTPAGITVGDSYSQLSAAYPGLAEEHNFGDNTAWAWLSSGSTNIFGPGLRGYLSSTPDGGPIESFFYPLPSLNSLYVGSIIGGENREFFYC